MAAQTKAEIDVLAADPSVVKAVETLKTLGFGDSNALLEKALRKGAATKAAMRGVNNEIYRLINQNTLSLDAPFSLD